jgi:hypothetical protein
LKSTAWRRKRRISLFPEWWAPSDSRGERTTVDGLCFNLLVSGVCARKFTLARMRFFQKTMSRRERVASAAARSLRRRRDPRPFPLAGVRRTFRSLTPARGEGVATPRSSRNRRPCEPRRAARRAGEGG